MPNIFDEEDKDLSGSNSTEQSEQNNTRSDKHKHKEKPKKVKREKTPEELEAIFQKRKKKKRNRRLIALAMVVLTVVSSVVSYQFLNTKIGETEANREILYQKLSEAFVDEENTEIISNISKKKVDEINRLYDSVKTTGTESVIEQWMETLTEQFSNQEDAKSKLNNLYEGSNNFIRGTVTEEELNETESAIGKKFNASYQTELLSEFTTLKKQFNDLDEANKAVASLYDENGQLNDFTKAELENIKAVIDRNPNKDLLRQQITRYDKALEEWEENLLNKQAEEERIRQEQEQKAQEQYEKELEQARKDAERQAEIDRQAQEAYEREQARLAQERAEREQAEREREEQARQEREEQERLEREQREQEERERQEREQQETNSSDLSSNTTTSSSERKNMITTSSSKNV